MSSASMAYKGRARGGWGGRKGAGEWMTTYGMRGGGQRGTQRGVRGAGVQEGVQGCVRRGAGEWNTT